MRNWLHTFLKIFLLLNVSLAFSFTFTATPTNETCTGNGSIAFIVSNKDPNGSIEFFIYKLPNISVPIASVSTNSANNLVSGSYLVIAKETVGNSFTTQQVQPIIILDRTIPFRYEVISTNQACSSASNISVIVKSGTAASYEIISGPVTFPLQTSNTFTNLPVGFYTIRVIDICGKAITQNHTVSINPVGLNIGPPVFTSATPPSCSFALATNTITPSDGTVISYPLTVQFVLHPPTGADIIYNITVPSGNPTSQDISQIVPTYINQSATYDITVTDDCGSTTTTNFAPNQNIAIGGVKKLATCGQYYLILSASNFTPPYTLTFTSTPAGFNPSTFNTIYPGPYTNAGVEFGDITHPVPQGTYDITILDACGRTTNTSVDVLFTLPIQSGSGNNNGCLFNTGNIQISIPDYDVVTAIITSAPAAFTNTNTLPYDVSSLIVNGSLSLDPYPLGNYIFQLTDNCNDIFPPLPVTIPPYQNQGLSKTIRPSCELNNGSLKLNSVNGKLTSVIMTSAPPGSGYITPLTLTTNINSSGIFLMNGLFEGNYTFDCIDECGFTNSITITIVGLEITSSTFSIQKNCGSFNIPLGVITNGNSATFWLQKRLNATTDTWGNPDTGVAYVNGATLTITNSKRLRNNFTNLNFAFNGTFRIIMQSKSFNNGSDLNSGTATNTDKFCQTILTPPPYLSFNEVLEIVDVYRMPCSSNGNLDLVVLANGAPPLHYKIVDESVFPPIILIDNGTSNVFYNLSPGIHRVRVEDNCGNSIPRDFDISTLSSLVTPIQPSNLVTCASSVTNSETFDLTIQTPIILGPSQSTTDFTISYYTTIGDAQAATNPITNLTNFNPTTNPQTIFARLIYNLLPNCYKTISFDLVVTQIPKLNLNSSYSSCVSSPVTLNASIGNLPTTTYLWEDGSTNPIRIISSLGLTNVSVTATNHTGTNSCISPIQNISVFLSDAPKFERIEVVDWTANENSITVYTSNTGDFLYSLDNINFQVENSFTNLYAGLYTVYTKDKFGCGAFEQTVWLLDYPRFFTPNSDGYNDRWYIKNSQFEPDFKVYIYDRFGKLITSFNSKSEGWDGTSNGNEQFSTDYWFVVIREDGRVHKGHFTLKR